MVSLVPYVIYIPCWRKEPIKIYISIKRSLLKPVKQGFRVTYDFKNEFFDIRGSRISHNDNLNDGLYKKYLDF